MTTVRLLLAIVASQSWPLYQMDVKNAFLHGDLKEDVYMRIPQGVTSPSKKSVCHLCRSLYGLKQAPRAWFKTFRDRLGTIDFTQSPYDPSLFLSHASTGFTVLLVYVDDVIITGTDDAMIKSLQASLRDSFHMKDLGPLHYFLGLEPIHDVSSPPSSDSREANYPEKELLRKKQQEIEEAECARRSKVVVTFDLVGRKDNSAQRFHLEHELSQFTQGTLSIQEYYSQFICLWTDYTEIIYSSLPDASIAVVQTIHSTSQRDQFLIKLRPDFEQICSNLMSRVPSPSIDSCFRELPREECLTTQAALQQALSTGPLIMAYVACSHQHNRDITKVRCYSCQKYGHVATQCNHKYCSYCKRKGHVLSECRHRAQTYS
ncbi:Retrovirus-related Pol polyprotein from transposon TNT 1-94 [Cinnamomum micranthum f. kanehirae]|uniref:Retrovirus-related Pol polyprotein from transposon TNT 1-94 n=1 Tax=Cinnamomum micranthum f. kanehirae TaxID=337451 RepID=A0A3S3NI36_9MAGN|nr:Retrovirus-related Pol polyprotein from transposon TNT 1-94 [Cinnamomum micranthum f. kanehirae]